MRPRQASRSSVFSVVSAFMVRSKYLPECPAGVKLPPLPSKKSSVLSGTNSQDKKGLNESRAAAWLYTLISPLSLATRVSFRDEYILFRVLWLDVAEMSPSTYD